MTIRGHEFPSFNGSKTGGVRCSKCGLEVRAYLANGGHLPHRLAAWVAAVTEDGRLVIPSRIKCRRAAATSATGAPEKSTGST